MRRLRLVGAGRVDRELADQRVAEAHTIAKLHDELTRLGRYPLIVIDEVGYIPFEAEAANLFVQLVSSRYEHASVIVTSNKPFGSLGRGVR
jgi:DNA replication protein DnaC